MRTTFLCMHHVSLKPVEDIRVSVLHHVHRIFLKLDAVKHGNEGGHCVANEGTKCICGKCFQQLSLFLCGSVPSPTVSQILVIVEEYNHELFKMYSLSCGAARHKVVHDHNEAG
jgi:hypothetical protein